LPTDYEAEGLRPFHKKHKAIKQLIDLSKCMLRTAERSGLFQNSPHIYYEENYEGV
jgi:hypothetical protein